MGSLYRGIRRDGKLNYKMKMGFYQDKYQLFGRYSFEIWRAIRLVVDTGMHYMQWTREQSINYMLEKSALSLLDSTSEIDR
jgi:uncharacterized protein (DUF885 family)